MMIDVGELQPLDDFQRHAPDYIRRMKETRSPVVLTVNGKAELVVQDAESYQALLETVERAETIEGIRRGLDQLRRVEGQPAEEVFAGMRKKFGVPDE